MRGRRPKTLPEDYILHLHNRGYSPSMIAYILQRDFGISVSRWTIWRRIRNFATASKAIQNEKAEVNCKT
jgi:intein-encoded DNA endonuclease-like protein